MEAKNRSIVTFLPPVTPYIYHPTRSEHQRGVFGPSKTSIFDTCNRNIQKHGAPGWVSQLSVGLLISGPVMISGFMKSSPTLGSALTAGSLLGIVFSLSLCARPLCTLALFLTR